MEEGATLRGSWEPGKGREGEPRARGLSPKATRDPRSLRSPFSAPPSGPPSRRVWTLGPCSSFAFSLLFPLLCGLSLRPQSHLGAASSSRARRGALRRVRVSGPRGGGARVGPAAAWGRPSPTFGPSPRAGSEVPSRRPLSPGRAEGECA